MAKKPHDRRVTDTDNKVRPLFGEQRFGEPKMGEYKSDKSWSPLEDGRRDQSRDQSYVRKVKPRTPQQATLLEAIRTTSLTLAIGPAGTGKTYLAISAAVEALEAGKVEKIILSRPAIESGESLGFLPGDFHEKMAPYLRPLYDALSDRLSSKTLKTMITDGDIEIAPVGYMRGRTLNNAFVVIDEAQNCTYAQLKMIMSRLGWHSTMVITGDPNQSDLLNGMSGLDEIATKLEVIEGLSVVRMTDADIVRHPLVGEILGALEKRKMPLE